MKKKRTLYVEPEYYERIINPKKDSNGETHELIFLNGDWSDLHEYRLDITITKIDKRPFLSKLKETWNRFVDRFKL